MNYYGVLLAVKSSRFTEFIPPFPLCNPLFRILRSPQDARNRKKHHRDYYYPYCVRIYSIYSIYSNSISVYFHSISHSLFVITSNEVDFISIFGIRTRSYSTNFVLSTRTVIACLRFDNEDKAAAFVYGGAKNGLARSDGRRVPQFAHTAERSR